LKTRIDFTIKPVRHTKAKTPPSVSAVRVPCACCTRIILHTIAALTPAYITHHASYTVRAQMTTRPADASDYDCAICLSAPEFQVHQCRNGHLFCAECLQECQARAVNAKCPTCRVALPREPIRNLVAERALARRPARCPHCSLDLTTGELQAHLARCPSRVVRCVGEGCAFSGPNKPGALKAHEAACPRAILAKTLVPLKARICQLEQTVRSLRSARNGLVSLYPPGAPLQIAHGLWRVREEENTFATVALPALRLTTGKWCYEVTVCSQEFIFPQIGWAHAGFRPQAEVGVGDDVHSYAYDGDRCKLWHEGGHDDFGEEWTEHDVVGCFIDLDERHISFAVNGELVQFDDEERAGAPAFDEIGGSGWFPALTLKCGLCRVNFGERDFEYPGVLEDYTQVAFARARHEPPLD